MLRPIRQRLIFDDPSDSGPMQDTEIAAIDVALKEQGKTRADLGRLLGLDSAQVSRLFNRKRRLQLHEAQKVHAWLGTPEKLAQSGAMVIPMPGVIPLYGSSTSGSGRELSLGDKNFRAYIPLHPRQANTRDPFAVEISDISMSPRYEPGEIVYLAANKWPSSQHDCLVILNNGEGHILKFLRRDTETVFARQFNPDRELTFSLKEITSIHSVVGRD